jgi:hypothetical protein
VRGAVSVAVFDMRVPFDDGLGKGLRGFLGKVVPDAALDRPVRIPAREFLGALGSGWGAPLASPPA